jgi:hypothetical protein
LAHSNDQDPFLRPWGEENVSSVVRDTARLDGNRVRRP